MKPAVNLALRLLACSAVTLLAYPVLGVKAVVVCSPLFGLALAGPLLSGLGQLPHWARRLAYRGFHGRYFEFRGRQVVVHEDLAGHRWVELNAVRALAPQLPVDLRLQRLYPRAFEPAAAQQPACLRAEELLLELRSCADPTALRFKLWLEREVAFPARTRRRRRGGGIAARSAIFRPSSAQPSDGGRPSPNHESEP
jgi:hypothetical protein